ncbi:MAG: hypothetical protein GEV08_21490 [Acidimicrobiia bacterium]|nr:hypothetical protein [Acidimicrobiia bacterium]
MNDRPRPHRPTPLPQGPARDQALGAALRALEVPRHRPGFWDRLDARLREAGPAAPGAHGAPGAGSAPVAGEGDDRRGQRAGPGDASGGGGGDDHDLDTAAGAEPTSPDRRRWRRFERRSALLVAAAAVVAIALAATALARRDPSSDVVMSPTPPEDSTPAESSAPASASPTATPSSVHATMAVREVAGGEVLHDLLVAPDGSYRWTAQDGSLDLAHDAVARRVVRVARGDVNLAQVVEGVPPGGPDRRAAGAPPPPLEAVGSFVVALGLGGDERVSEVVVAGRGAWRYEGPMSPDLLGVNSADQVLVDVDRETGVILTLRETAPSGAVLRSWETTTFETSIAVDAGAGAGAGPGNAGPDGGAAAGTGAGAAERGAFQLDPPADLEPVIADLGFRAATVDDAAVVVGYQPVVPGAVPAGFVLDSVMVNGGEAPAIGPEGMLASSQVTVLRWRAGARQFTVTTRTDPGVADDPFAVEGVPAAGEHLEPAPGDESPVAPPSSWRRPMAPTRGGRRPGCWSPWTAT